MDSKERLQMGEAGGGEKHKVIEYVGHVGQLALFLRSTGWWLKRTRTIGTIRYSPWGDSDHNRSHCSI